MTLDHNPKDILEAINLIYSSIGYVQKEGKVSFGNTNYKFAGEAAFIAALRPVMVKYGVTVRPKDVQLVYNAPGHVILRCKYSFEHTSGTAVTVCSMGEGKDTGDKAIPKALTGAYKYALRQTFMIETGDDPDKVSSEELVHLEQEVKKPFKNAAERKVLNDALSLALDDVKDLEGLNKLWLDMGKDFNDRIKQEGDKDWLLQLENVIGRFSNYKKVFTEKEKENDV